MGSGSADGQVRLVPAGSLEPAALTEVFKLGFSGYLVPLRMDEDGLREHVAVNDIDVDHSIVAVGAEPVGFVLTGRRGSAAWIGGMGVAPGHRRTGLGARLLSAALHAASRAGADSVWLEVLEANHAAIGLYERLGFERGRHLAIWSLAPAARGAPEQRALDLDAAHAWIAAHRGGQEPSQRADASLVHMRERGAPLSAVAVLGSDGIAGAAICKADGVTVTVIQLAALSEAAAGDLIIAAAGAQTLRLSNIPSDDVFSAVLRRLGADLVITQHEMRRDLSA
ncbi:MAG: GNAT family N-acetyltransferase [Solirubrobacteraceae bacterium]